jgi:hypothetical protein
MLAKFDKRLEKISDEGERRERVALAESLAEIATSGSREQLSALEAALEDVRDEAGYQDVRAKEDVHVLRAQNALRVLVDRARIREECYRTAEVEEMLGVSRERLGQLREDGKLVGIVVEGERRSTLYPYWQFGEEGLLEGLEEIVASAREADMDPETLHFFMTEPNDRLGGRTPAELLQEGEAGHVAWILKTSGLGSF